MRFVSVFTVAILCGAPSGFGQAIQRVDKPEAWTKSLRTEVEKLDGQAFDQDFADKDRAQAALKAGNLHAKMSKWQDTSTDQSLRDAASSFEIAARLGSPVEKTKAHNNCGAIFLKLNEFEKADKCFEQCDLGLIPQQHQYVLHYNRGLVFLNLEKLDSAVAQFADSYAKNPGFLKAANQTLLIVFAEPSSSFSQQGYDTVERLVENGHAEYLLQFCEKQFDQRQKNKTDLLLTSYALSLAESRITPDQFVESKLEKISAWEKNLRELPLRGCSGELRNAYVDRELRWSKASVEDFQVSQFAWWSSPERSDACRRAFSKLLKNIGDYYSGTGLFVDPQRRVFENSRFENSLNRYLLAWTVDPGNFAAAEAVAAVLLEYKTNVSENKIEILDEAQIKQIEARLKEITDNVFEAKTQKIYLRNKTDKDYRQLQGMHILLGRIYEKSGELGSRNEPRSAIYQYERALAISDKMTDPSVSGDLHRRLAEAYQQQEKPEQSLENYKKSIQWQQVHGNSKDAIETIKAASTLKINKVQKKEIDDMSKELDTIIKSRKSLGPTRNDKLGPTRNDKLRIK